ncbi:MAG: D-alanyl-D-alanine carboxypeptidase/D-alanyl-D-alanine-endopeptidase [Verrucomicrobia bacterium]|nr:D-alanyl-D-alanine carboxypeptidase/D-alanyl-D-alanine-endopeptidase [Verrucomicrobiota bacterium]
MISRVFVLLFLVAFPLFGGLREEVDAIIAGVDPDVHLGIEVVSLRTGESVLARNHNQLFVPGSTLKLFTAAAALHYLGRDFRFETRLYADGKIAEGGLEGDLYIQGAGDPELSLADLEVLACELPFEKISGNLYVDRTLFDTVVWGPGWMWDEGAELWNSPMAALTVNHSAVEVWVEPSEKVGEMARVRLEPACHFLSLACKATTSQNQEGLFVERRWRTRENIIDIQGALPIHSKPQVFRVSVEDPELFVAALLRDLLVRKGVRFSGKIAFKAVPEKAKVVGTVFSRPLQEMISSFLKKSDNLASNCVFKKIGEKCYGKPGTWSKGTKAVQAFLDKEVGLDTSRMVVVDGSGESRYNLSSPHQFVQFLVWMHKHYPDFSKTLAIGGYDGTLKNRMVKGRCKGKVFAKTGLMTGVTGISGYLLTDSGEPLVFSILQGGFIRGAMEYREGIEDAILEKLVAQPH